HMKIRTFSSPEPFKQALEQRLRSASKTGGEFAHRRQLLVFDRFLARIMALLGEAAMLKGGSHGVRWLHCDIVADCNYEQPQYNL
ncbi:hypothetical protein KKC22_11550, partial [Myxococcota bacterium]|nr:hypothetical protein [Myxococcota bacterium]